MKIGLADPDGAALYSYYTTGELKAEGRSITEGIGQGRITANLEGLRRRHGLPHPRRRGAADRLRPARATRGSASAARPGINVAGAIRMAREMGPGHTIVTILCDYGTPLPVQALQPRLPARQGPAGAGLAGPRRRARCRAFSRDDAAAASCGQDCGQFRRRVRAILLRCCWCWPRRCCSPPWPQRPQPRRRRRRSTMPPGTRTRPGRGQPGEGTASRPGAEQLRADIVDWRSQFARAQTANQAQIETVKSQIAALGPLPAEGAAEAPEIAARRSDLNDHLARIAGSGAAAVEAYSRADGVIRQIDATIRARGRRTSFCGSRPRRPIRSTGRPVVAVLTQGVQTCGPRRREAWSEPGAAHAAEQQPAGDRCFTC